MVSSQALSQLQHSVSDSERWTEQCPSVSFLTSLITFAFAYCTGGALLRSQSCLSGWAGASPALSNHWKRKSCIFFFRSEMHLTNWLTWSLVGCKSQAVRQCPKLSLPWAVFPHRTGNSMKQTLLLDLSYRSSSKDTSHFQPICTSCFLLMPT